MMLFLESGSWRRKLKISSFSPPMQLRHWKCPCFLNVFKKHPKYIDMLIRKFYGGSLGLQLTAPPHNQNDTILDRAAHSTQSYITLNLPKFNHTHRVSKIGKFYLLNRKYETVEICLNKYLISFHFKGISKIINCSQITV